LGQQHQDQRLKEAEQRDKGGWLGAGDCSRSPGPDVKGSMQDMLMNLKNNTACPLHNIMIKQ